MFLNKLIAPTIFFNSSGGSSSGGKSKSSNRSSSSNKTKTATTSVKPSSSAPKTSPRPVARPTVTNTYQGPNMDGSAGYKATYSTVTSPVDSNGYLKSGPDRVTTMDNKEITNVGKTIGGKDYTMSGPVSAPAAPAPSNNDPVTAPETVDPSNGVGGGRDGGGSAKRQASKTQEDNIAVRRSAAGVSGYKTDAPQSARLAAIERRRRSAMTIRKN